MEEARAEEARRLEEHTLAAFRRRLRDELAPASALVCVAARPRARRRARPEPRGGGRGGGCRGASEQLPQRPNAARPGCRHTVAAAAAPSARAGGRTEPGAEAVYGTLAAERDEPQLRVLREAGMHLVVRWLVAPRAEQKGEQRYVDVENEVRHRLS